MILCGALANKPKTAKTNPHLFNARRKLIVLPFKTYRLTKVNSMSRGEYSKESEQRDSDKLDELAELLRQLLSPCF
jgi:hypothetical protein